MTMGTPPGPTRPDGAGRAPGPRPGRFLGNVAEVRRKGLVRFYEDAWRAYGDVVRFEMGPLVQHLVVRPEAVEHVLLTHRDTYPKGRGYQKLKLALGDGLFLSEGDLWSRQRRLMSPLFTPRGVGRFTDAMAGATAALLDEWDALARAGQPVEVNGAMTRLAMTIIARSMFSLDLGGEGVAAAAAFTYVLEYLSRRSVSFVDLPMWVPTPANRRFRQALATLDAFIGGVIDARQGSGEQPDDLLTLLLAARDPDTGAAMSRQQVRDEVITVFFAGHETTAQALTWAWWLVGRHPEVEARLHAEVDGVLPGGTVTADHLPALAYTRMVVDEAMRLYPPVWIYVRDAAVDDELGGYTIPAGSMIVLSQYLTHRHPELWDRPEAFDPERFTPERSADRHRFAYFPFGGGPRVCIGNSFALQEAVTVLAMTARRFQLRPLPGSAVQPKMVGTLRPDGPVWMSATVRARS
jgi:cytochrome P450